jgi:hypothetical protein
MAFTSYTTTVLFLSLFLVCPLGFCYFLLCANLSPISVVFPIVGTPLTQGLFVTFLIIHDPSLNILIQHGGSTFLPFVSRNLLLLAVVILLSNSPAFVLQVILLHEGLVSPSSDGSGGDMSSNTSVNFPRTARRYVAEDTTLYFSPCFWKGESRLTKYTYIVNYGLLPAISPRTRPRIHIFSCTLIRC